jgi:hypothetical protein
MRTHRFGRKIKLPATLVIKHQIRMLMAQDEVRKAEAQFVGHSVRQLSSGEPEIKAVGVSHL